MGNEDEQYPEVELTIIAVENGYGVTLEDKYYVFRTFLELSNDMPKLLLSYLPEKELM